MFTYTFAFYNFAPGGMFITLKLKLIPALFGVAFEITISRLQTWSDMVRCGN